MNDDIEKISDQICEIFDKKVDSLTEQQAEHLNLSNNSMYFYMKLGEYDKAIWNARQTLKYLKQINLVHSNFEADYLEDLYSFPALEKVYLFGTPLNTSDIEIPEPYRSIYEKGYYKLDVELEETL